MSELQQQRVSPYVSPYVQMMNLGLKGFESTGREDFFDIPWAAYLPGW